MAPGGSAPGAAAADAARAKWQKQPPLPADRNPLLGKWTRPASTRPNPNDPFAQLQALAKGGMCEVLFGGGVFEFRPDRLIGMDERTREQELDRVLTCKSPTCPVQGSSLETARCAGAFLATAIPLCYKGCAELPPTICKLLDDWMSIRRACCATLGHEGRASMAERPVRGLTGSYHCHNNNRRRDHHAISRSGATSFGV
jgi:hypothetical protein